MESKILKGSKIIAELGSDYDLKAWHEACVKIMNLGLNKENLKDYMNQIDFKHNKTLSQSDKGSYAQAAGYIRNFIDWNENVSFIKDISGLLQKFVKESK